MEDMLICQCCSMPLSKDEDFGTNKDGSKNNDYCVYCFKEGEFIGYKTLEEAILDSVNFAEHAGMTPEEMLKHSRELLPTLKRWKCTCSEECASGHNPNCECTSSECHCAE